MDEIEQRLAALELLLIEILGDAGPGLREAAAKRIGDGLARATDSDELTIRSQALHLIEAAGGRDVVFRLGSRT